MKVRNGFVSNSSTSSFCIMGVVRVEPKTNCEVDDQFRKNDSIDFSRGLYNFSEDEIIFGLSCCKMRNEETLEHFKNRVFHVVKEIDDSVVLKEIEWRVDGG